MKKFKLKINGKDYNVSINDSENNDLIVNVNGTDYIVELDNEEDKISQVKPKTVSKPQFKKTETSAPPPQQKTSASSAKSVLAPLPGVILEIKVKKGDAVKNGDVVLIMEAMKMENNIISEHDGVVAAISVNQGQTVMQNDVLIEIQ